MPRIPKDCCKKYYRKRFTSIILTYVDQVDKIDLEMLMVADLLIHCNAGSIKESTPNELGRFISSRVMKRRKIEGKILKRKGQ